ncbi:energy-coupling factor ABC transporter ATP-binding protein [Mycetocola spongiae]|uniref:energy-coupling factor ABC transporter ATP-binding protein n=1 Tax=Mycetocola spongiae TaxID=2859226 RepID=UPI001CF14987|nr:ABC transporter ATP-binding protein [Mycetocola spongiae]UCR88502.1 energy-coupling factor ABC transporter ATP-binding protein [Mycetocola spongiae]
MSEAIILEGVGVDLGGRPVLRDVSVHLEERRIAVIGSNGSGKSTFARLLNGLNRADYGSLSVHGIDPARRVAALRRRVGFVFTNPDAQIVMPTVAEDVAFSLRGRGLSRSEIAERVARVLAENGLSEHHDAPAYTLSGGQKQLLALCSVLVSEPRLLVADEPTTLLDAANTRRIGNLLLGLDQQLVLLTHNLDLAERCDIALRFEGGRLVESGDPAEVVGRYRREHAS